MTDTHDTPRRDSDAGDATDELRRLLDERGVEHYDGTETTLWLKGSVGYRANAVEGSSGFIHLHLWCTTPAQAVDATLGRGTCTMDHEDGNDTWWSCNACDADVYLPTKPKFCWNCGREVVE